MARPDAILEQSSSPGAEGASQNRPRALIAEIICAAVDESPNAEWSVRGQSEAAAVDEVPSAECDAAFVLSGSCCQEVCEDPPLAIQSPSSAPASPGARVLVASAGPSVCRSSPPVVGPHSTLAPGGVLGHCLGGNAAGRWRQGAWGAVGGSAAAPCWPSALGLRLDGAHLDHSLGPELRPSPQRSRLTAAERSAIFSVPLGRVGADAPALRAQAAAVRVTMQERYEPFRDEVGDFPLADEERQTVPLTRLRMSAPERSWRRNQAASAWYEEGQLQGCPRGQDRLDLACQLPAAGHGLVGSPSPTARLSASPSNSAAFWPSRRRRAAPLPPFLPSRQGDELPFFWQRSPWRLGGAATSGPISLRAEMRLCTRPLGASHIERLVPLA